MNKINKEIYCEEGNSMINISLGISHSNITGSFSVSDLLKKIRDWNVVRKSRIENLEFISPVSSSLEIAAITKYKHSFYVFHSLSFHGNFGDDPDVFLIYSENDSKISFDSNNQALYGDSLSVNKLKKVGLSNGKYEYKLSKQMCYYSDKESEYDIRPFIIVIIGKNNLGLATITLINKSFSKRVNQGEGRMQLPIGGKNIFVPQARKLVWPSGNELYKKLREPQTGRVFYLDKEDVNVVLDLKHYFISILQSKEGRAYSSKYLGGN